MRIITKAKNLGFCYGVKRAIEIVHNVINNNYPKPIYLLGNLVHNHHISDYFASLGIIILEEGTRLEMLDKITMGTVIFTAHGVSDEVVKKAQNKHLTIVDATCPYVKKTFEKMKEQLNNGYDLLFVGSKNHPETEAALALSSHVHLYNETLKDLKNPLLCHQTTMSSYDIMAIYDDLKKTYPSIKKMDMICKVSEQRQQEILSLSDYSFTTPALIIIIGDKTSNNSNKLLEMARRIQKTDVLFIDQLTDLNFQTLKKYQEIFISSGTSTPHAIVDELYDLLLNLDNLTKEKYVSKLTLKNYLD